MSVEVTRSMVLRASPGQLLTWSRLCARAASASGVDTKVQGQLKQMSAILERAGKPGDPRYEAFAAIIKAEPDPIARTVTVAVAICGSSQPGAAPQSSTSSTSSTSTPPSSRPGPRDWISMVKVEASETLGRVADRAVQVFGGMGYCADLPVERLYRDARIFRIFDGTSEIHRGVVARSALRKGAPLWDIGVQ